jgi:uncharacterized protein YbaP (TraB family)
MAAFAFHPDAGARMIRTMFKIGLLLAGLAVMPAGAAVYKCADAAGRLTLQDRPCGPDMTPRGGPVPAAAQGHLMMWQVAGPRGSAYLVGSIHFGVPAMYPLPAAMTEAFQQSQALVVETDLTKLSPEQMAQAVAEKAMYRGDRALSQALSPATRQELDKVLAEFGVPPQLVEQQKPWFISMTLTSLALRRFGFDEELGIDNHFMNLAAGHKPIIELETFRQQLDFLDGFSAPDQEVMLKETFDDINKGREFLADTLKAWRSGDAGAIDELMNRELRDGSAADRHMYQVLVAQRNIAMTDKLDRLLAKGGRYFVVLGAAHFVGNDGIAAKLRRRGYQVRKY